MSKNAKLVELVNNVNTFSDAWDVSQVIYDRKAKGDNFTTNDFEFTFKENNVTCSVVKVIKKTENKVATYTKTTEFKESARNMPEAFKKAALRLLS